MDNLKHSIEDVINSKDHTEYINGMIVVENVATTTHNRVIRAILRSLENYIQANNVACEVFIENVGLFVNELTNNDRNFFLPDVMVVCEPEGIKEDGIHCVPLFIAEVTSEATKKHDYNQKMDVYRDIGVKEYWVVDLQRKSVFKFLDDDGYIPQAYVHPNTVDVSVYPGLSIDLSEFMSE